MATVPLRTNECDSFLRKFKKRILITRLLIKTGKIFILLFCILYYKNETGSQWKGPIPLLATSFYFLLYISILSLIFSYLTGEMRVRSSNIESNGMLLKDIVYMELSKDGSINTISLLNLRDSSFEI